MKKVVNITLHAINNYGSVFQTQATEYLIELLGYECETIDFVRETAIPKSVIEIIFEKKYNLIYKIKLILLQSSFSRNARVFDCFRYKWLHLSKKKYLGDLSIEQDPPIADIYCTGSDQVWNSEIQEGIPGPFLLNFAPDKSKKIAFSASFGLESIEARYRSEYKKLLSRYDHISVRENSAITLLSSFGIKSSFVLDPTLVAGRELWDKVASPRLIKEDYILIYQMGSDRRLSNYAKEYAKYHRKKLIRICNDYFKVLLSGTPILFPTPENMLSLFKYSGCTITNSFHATAFSLIYERQLIEVFPDKFSTRVASILDLVGITDEVLLKDYSDYTIGDKMLDYDSINNILETKRKESVKFLKEALND